MISTSIAKAVTILNNEDVVAIPTETVYGLAANIFSEKAVKKIFEMKQRPLFNPLIVHIHSIDQLAKLTDHVPDKAKILAQYFWPGPLTLVLKKHESVPDLVTAGKNSVAVRMPNHPVTLNLLQSLKFPLAAPSANPFGCISPTKAEHVAEYFGEKLKMILEGGNCENGIESTIIGFEADEPILYRYGAISLEEIEEKIGTVIIKNKEEISPNAPGMLLKHYAPKTRTYLETNVEECLKLFPNKKIGILLFSKKIEAPENVYQMVLSENADFKEAAANLYESLHHLDKLKFDLIIVEKLPDHDLGVSINDRLKRATAK